MSTTFRVDPDLDYVVGRSGADWTTNVITGWGGLYAAIAGLGLTAAAAGDAILVKPHTYKLSRLVTITVNVTTSWVAGDAITDNCGPPGSVWQGVVVQVVSGTVAILQTSGNYGHDDIKNNTNYGALCHGQAATIASSANVAANGILLNTNAGTIAALITITGVNKDGDDDGSVVTLDGDSDATTGFYVYKNFWKFKNLLVTLTTAYGWRTNLDAYIQGLEFSNCEANNTGSGFYLQNASYNNNLWRCRAINNTGYGFYGGYYQGMGLEACEAIANGNNGIHLAGSGRGNDLIQWCVAAANTGHGIYVAGANGTEILNNVIDGNGPAGDGDGIYVAAGAYAKIIGNRITNNGGTSGSHYGINVVSGAAVYYGWNFLLGNRTAPTNGTLTALSYGATANTNITSGNEAYVAKGASLYDYRCTEAKEADSTIVLGTSSPANSAISISMGIPRPSPVYPTAAQVQDTIKFGFNEYWTGSLAGGAGGGPQGPGGGGKQDGGMRPGI